MGSKTPNILSWDLESTNLNADFGYLLCGGVKKLGTDKVDIYRIDDNNKKFSEDPTNDKQLVLALRKRLSEADMWITWYGGKFDVPMLNSRLLYHHLAPMPPVPHMDMWRVCREKLKIHSNRLASACAFLGLPAKTPVDGPMWVRAMSGHRPSLKYIVDHCRQDVVVLEMAYLKLRPLTTTVRPNISLMADMPDGCPVCAAPPSSLQKRGHSVKKTGIARRYQCQKCGGWSHGPDQRVKGLEAR